MPRGSPPGLFTHDMAGVLPRESELREKERERAARKVKSLYDLTWEGTLLPLPYGPGLTEQPWQDTREDVTRA